MTPGLHRALGRTFDKEIHAAARCGMTLAALQRILQNLTPGTGTWRRRRRRADLAGCPDSGAPVHRTVNVSTGETENGGTRPRIWGQTPWTVIGGSG